MKNTKYTNHEPRTTNHKTRIVILFSLVIICLTLPQPAQAAEYYLDAVNGNDSYPGTSEVPWRTVDRAMPDWSGTPRVTLGDNVLLRSGNYGRVLFDWHYSNNPQPVSWNDKITYKADVGHTPVFESMRISHDYNRYLEFDGINIEVTTKEMPSGRYAVEVYYASALRFKNMDIKGYWTNTTRGGLSSAGIRVRSNVDLGEYLIENCTIHSVQSGIQFVEPTGNRIAPIVIRNNTIYDIPGHCISMNVRGGEKMAIEGNYLYGYHQDFDYWVFNVNQDVGTNWTGWEPLTQDITGATGFLGPSLTGGTRLMVYPNSDIAWEVGEGKTIRGTGIPALTPLSVNYQAVSHESGIALRGDNVDIRNNTIRTFGGTGSIHTFPEETYEPLATTGYCNLLIENNLLYDAGIYALKLQDLGTNVTIRNNTIVGYRGPDYPSGSRNGYYYRVPAMLELKSGRDGSGIKLYNNIIVGGLLLDSDWTAYEEDNNLIYAVLQGGWKTSLSGGSTIIYSNGSNEPTVFDSDFFVDPDYTIYIHGRVCDYRLKEGSPAINFGDSTYAPLTDILGNQRDSQPDAGCYEYRQLQTDLIINHTAVDDFDKIPEYWIEKVKSDKMLVQYIGQSHSRQMPYGLQLLENQNSKYSFQGASNPTSFNENSLRVLDGKYIPNSWSWGANHDSYWSTEAAKTITINTALQAKNLGYPLNISIWAWSYHIINDGYYGGTFGDTDMNNYLNAIAQFNSNPEINQTKYIYHTSVIDSTTMGDYPWRVTYYNNVIRQAAQANNGILFDQADIENWNNNDTEQRVYIDYQGRTTYLRHRDYDETVLPNTYDYDHTNDALEIRKAKALWVLMARLAGWDGAAGGDTTAPSIPENLTATAISENQIDLTWNASDDPESGIDHYNIYRDGTRISTSATTSYSDTGLTPETTYSYEVTAVNGAGLESARSNLVQATTLAPVPDTTPPGIVSVNANSQTSVVVVFNEPLDIVSAEEINSYSINNGITISSANLSANLTTVTLTTSSHTEGSYTLTVGNVKDIAGNPMPQTQINYQYTATTNLVLYLNCDNNVTDQSGNNNNGTWNGTASYASGIFNQAILLDGATSYIRVSHHASLDGMSQLTLSSWARKNIADVSGSMAIFHKHAAYNLNIASNQTSGYLIDATGTRVNLNLTSETIHDTQWHHYAVTYDGTTVRQYIDGQPVGLPQSLSGNLAVVASHPLLIGSYLGTGNFFNGAIDEPRIYNRALSANEILDLFNNISAPPVLYGDVSGDGEISAFDAALAAHIAVDLEHPDIKNPAAAEVSGDGQVSAYDAALIAQRAVGLIDKFPVEQ